MANNSFSSIPSLSGKRVLVADADSRMVELLTSSFQEAGCEVVSASEGRAVNECIRGVAPNLMILNTMLPQCDELLLCRNIRLNPETRFMAVILLSEKTEPRHRIEGLEAGADDYIIKPFDPAEVLLRARAALQRRFSGMIVEEIHVDDLVINRRKRFVKLGDKILNLTETEYLLLLNLAESVGELRSRSSLLADVFDDSPVEGSRTLDTHISRLRSKLGDYSNRIETVHGKGYRMA